MMSRIAQMVEHCHAKSEIVDSSAGIVIFHRWNL